MIYILNGYVDMWNVHREIALMEIVFYKCELF